MHTRTHTHTPKDAHTHTNTRIDAHTHTHTRAHSHVLKHRFDHSSFYRETPKTPLLIGNVDFQITILLFCITCVLRFTFIYLSFPVHFFVCLISFRSLLSSSFLSLLASFLSFLSLPYFFLPFSFLSSLPSSFSFLLYPSLFPFLPPQSMLSPHLSLSFFPFTIFVLYHCY